MRSNMISMLGNAKLLKELNRSVILNHIRQREPISRTDLVELTGLGLPTVLRNVNALIEEEFVQEIGKADTTSGRKPIMLTINPKASHIIGIQIGRQLGVILTDFKGSIIEDHLENLPLESNPETVVNRAYEIVSDLMLHNQLTFEGICGIGIAATGLHFNAVEMSNQGLAEISAHFFKKFSQVRVVVEWTTLCGAIGEQWFGKTKNYKNNIYIYADTIIGAGMIVGGEVYRGKDGLAGQIGHSSIDLNGDRCSCGRRGCLETYASSVFILQKIRKRIEMGVKSAVLDLAGGDASKINFNHVATAAYRGDQLCSYTLKEAGRALGIGIANIINTINPDAIVLGGEVFWLCPAVVDTAIAVARENIFYDQARIIEILVSDIRYYAEAKGALALVLNETYQVPSLL